MSKKEKDIAFFVAFCIEEYRAAKGLTGEEVMELFAKYGVTDYLSKCFEPLHTQGREWLIADIDEFINSLPDKYDTILEDNQSLSEGQKQLITIARAIVDDSHFLILDEATSSVDRKTEEVVQRAMDELTKDRTSFIIAHRLSTIQNADLILVLDDGDIIEQGTHDELLKKNGFYADLYNSQFEI